ncbi:hypothetical protein GCM10027346_36300 [Hymenobacter seoulensis]
MALLARAWITGVTCVQPSPQPSRHQLVHAVGPGPNAEGTSPYHLVQHVQANLKRLGTDLVQLQGWDPATPAVATTV